MQASTVDYIPPPKIWLALTEAHRAVGEAASLKLSRRLLKKAPRGDGHGVMIIPGFMSNDGYNSMLLDYLGELGYTATGWEQGRNLGPREGILEGLEDHLRKLYKQSGGPVSLIGHSLGGIYAREIARMYPDLVRQVISLGSPFGEGRDTGSLPRRLFSALNPQERIDIDQTLLASAPPVPTTAVYTKGDGIVNWKTAVQVDGHEQTQNIEVRGSHCGLTLNPSVWFLLAERLAQPGHAWAPFERRTWHKLFYPSA